MSSNRRKPVVSFTRKGKNMEHQNQTDSAGVPIIEGVNAKIGVLERRREYLQRKLDQPGYSRQPGYDFDRHEVSAIDAALRALADAGPDDAAVEAAARVIEQDVKDYSGGFVTVEEAKKIARAALAAAFKTMGR